MKVKISYKISESDTKRIRKEMKETEDANAYRRLEVVALLGEGKSPLEVAEITNFHPKYVRTLGCKFNRNGLESFVDYGRKGGNNRSMSPEGASEFKTIRGKSEERTSDYCRRDIHGIQQANRKRERIAFDHLLLFT